MAERDVLVIRKDATLGTGWRPVTVSTEIYQTIKSLADEANLPLSKVACMLIDFAVERVVIEK